MATLTDVPVRVRGVSRAFDGRTVLDGIDLDIADAQIVALLGRSGTGKSTLLRILAGLDDGYTGTVIRPDRVAVAFQEPRLLPWKRVADNVGLGLSTRDARERVGAALSEVGLSGHARAWPLTLSGGEAQRASLARALVRDPALLLLDEPFAALDALTRLSMHQLVLDLWQRHRPAVLLVTHDVDEAVALADRIVVLDAGRITVDQTIDLPRPRERGGARFAEHRRGLLAALGVEQA
ncbi:MAG: sulfonate transporter ATP-binding protein [Dactylosporangium sp.]|jgi:sulfonate transport system ATP-binding protein|nr:sulfonate transporter ATP-binding protein [Dactylosporangium sp.]